MRAKLCDISLEPDPRTLPADPAEFCFQAVLFVGEDGGQPGGEMIRVTVCSAEWMAARARTEGIVDGAWRVIVDFDGYSEQRLRDWFAKRVNQISGRDWNEIGAMFGRLGQWEFEGYQSSP
jgi:hypothetical protein